MDRLSEQEANDVAAKWVDNLRTRFQIMGLSSGGSSELYPDFPASRRVDTEEVRATAKTLQNRGEIEQRKVFKNDGVLYDIDLAVASRGQQHLIQEFQTTDDPRKFGNTLSDDTSETVETTTTRSTSEASSAPVDLDWLRRTRLAYYRQPDVRDDKSEDIESEQRQSCLSGRQLDSSQSKKISPPLSRISPGHSEEDGFYKRPYPSSTTSSSRDWDNWTSTNSDGTPRLESITDQKSNVEFMLDWWGLGDQSTAPELRMYLPTSRTKSDNSKKTNVNSENSNVTCHSDRCNKREGDELRSKNEFHVFPVGFDREDSELGNDGFQNGVPSSDESSDFTLDDPVSKPKSPRASSYLLSGNTPRNYSRSKSTLSQSTSPPVPQIKGSLYHEFSQNEMNGTFEDVPTEKSTVPKTDDFVDRAAWRRPRSLSQPNALQNGGIFCPNESDANIEIFCNLLGKHCHDICWKNNDLKEDIVSEMSLKAHNMKLIEANCDVSSDFGSELVRPISGGEFHAEKNLAIMNVRVCPDCREVNDSCANWCIECGLALVNVKPSKPVHNKKPVTSKKPVDEITSSSTNSEPPTQGLAQNKSSSNENCAADPSPSGGNAKKNTWKEFKQNGRRWEKSSLAWNTYQDSHLSKPPGAKHPKSRSRNNFAIPERSENGIGRPQSASGKHSLKKSTNGNSQNNNNQNATGSWPRSYKGQETKIKKRNTWNPKSSSEMKVTGSKAMQEARSTKKDLSLDLTGLDDYAGMTEMIRSNRGNPLPYLCLPDEIILRIFDHLSHADIASCSSVCQQLNRICEDECLWKTIVLKKNHNICDEFLEKIGLRKPVSLSLIQCHGNLVTSTGLRELFRQCAENLEELNFSGCSGGQLIGESILLHVALRCNKLRSVDASWTNVGDNGVEALVQNVDRLECLCLNGCQAITDNSLKVLADKHGDSLRTFEIFGCFNVSAAGIKRLGQKCPNLQTLNLGQCYKITSAAIGQLVSHLESIVNLDLRGCKQAKDACVKTIAKHCPLLVNLVLANCPLITDVAMSEIAINLPSVRCLDVCGCVKVTDHGVRALARSCNRLNYLDLSSTSITQKSVMLLANYCSQNLESLKLSFCVDVTDDSVSRLVKHCKRMTTLHLYGCKRLRNLQALQKLNHSLKLEF